MARRPLDGIVRSTGEVPLCWAGSTSLMDYLNFEDALSPVMVAMVGGVPVRRIPARSASLRMAAIGAIGHTLEAGEVHAWGTGCSQWKNPYAAGDQRVAYARSADSPIVLHAASGPLAEKLMSDKRHGVYGDPAWLLPRFYQPRIKKKWKLGVILHLSELANRSYEAQPLPAFLRYQVPDEMKDDVHLITTVAPLGVQSVKAKLDEILACERIVSMSMHGMIIAETYGIPCLYFSPTSESRGLGWLDLDPNGPFDLRIVDMYLGLGRSRIPAYFQDRSQQTDWKRLMADVDGAWERTEFDADRLVEALPFTPSTLKVSAGKSIWQHPVVEGLTLQHDVELLRRQNSVPEQSPSSTQTEVGRSSKGSSGAMSVSMVNDLAGRETKVTSPTMSPETATLIRMNANNISIPLSWAATTPESPYANLGDTLSAMIVAGIAGVSVRRAGFDQPVERMVSVGTIGHNQRSGVLHFWGTGVDAERNPVDPKIHGYIRPANTEFHIHALRGPNSARTLRAAGIEVPEIFGDPVWMLPRFWPLKEVEKTHDLGVILHITELDGRTPEARVKAALRRYQIPKQFARRIRLINTHCPPTVEGMRRKVAEIVSCRAIASTSLHGLVISETYGIPCAWFATYGDGEGKMLDLGNPEQQIDHRMRDFYSGVGRTALSSFCLDRARMTDWGKLLDWIHGSWQPLVYDDAPLIRAFPMPRAVSPEDASWPLPSEVVDRIDY